MKKYKSISILDSFSLIALFGFSSKKDKVFKKMIKNTNKPYNGFKNDGLKADMENMNNDRIKLFGDYTKKW